MGLISGDVAIKTEVSRNEFSCKLLNIKAHDRIFSVLPGFHRISYAFPIPSPGYISRGRLNGILGLTRAFGDISFKEYPPEREGDLWERQQLTSQPEMNSVSVVTWLLAATCPVMHYGGLQPEKSR